MTNLERKLKRLMVHIDRFIENDNPEIDMDECQRTYIISCLVDIEGDGDPTQITYNIDPAMFGCGKNTSFTDIRKRGGKMSLMTHMIHQQSENIVAQAKQHVDMVCNADDIIVRLSVK